MSAKHPRIHTVLEPELYRVVERLARESGVSLSQKVRDLVAGSMEVIEDAELDRFAEERRRTFHPLRALTPAQVRRRLESRRRG